MGIEIVHGVDGLGVHVPARVPSARVDREAEIARGIAHVLVEARTADGRGRIADGAVVVEGGLDEAVAGGAGDPFLGHWLADVGREGGILDVVAGGNEIFDLVIEEGEVEHAVHVVTEREHAVVGAEGPEPGLPQALEADLAEDPPQEEEERVAPVGGVRPVADRFHVQMSLEHSADQLEHLVGDIRRAVGEHDGRAQIGGGGRGGVGQITGELDQVGKHAAPRRRPDFLDRVAGIAADVKLLPRVAGEG
jgi:hypothetical protein